MDLETLRAAFHGTPLYERRWLERLILTGPRAAYAVEISPNELVEVWRLARTLSNLTQHWPVAVTTWSGAGGDWAQRIAAEDLFSRFYFSESTPQLDVSPEAILARADHVAVDRVLHTLDERARASEETLEEISDFELAETARRLGHAPTREELSEAARSGARLERPADLDRWLYDYENAAAKPAPDTQHLAWFEPQDPLALLFLPITQGGDALAFLHWYGAVGQPAELFVALLRSWQSRFGAELVAHYGTMLQFVVENPPTDPGQAWTLAHEHARVAPGTLHLPGVALRDHARALLGNPRWFLHERP